MKREREGEVADMADCLISLSKVNDIYRPPENPAGTSPSRVFVCKTCDRRFSSFQALGGHRASHKKPKFTETALRSPEKTKTHECPICGVDFPIGQALGGHMRRHRRTEGSPAPAAEKSGATIRVFGVDLKLAAMEKDDLKLQLMSPVVGFLF